MCTIRKEINLIDSVARSRDTEPATLPLDKVECIGNKFARASEQMDNIIKNITHPMLSSLGSIKINALRRFPQMQRESKCCAGRWIRRRRRK
jgi:hypothetical protein